jgi:hypothetical protein
LAQIPSIFATTILTDVLWIAVAYLYFALGTKLAHQFLLFGVCLVGGLVMLWRAGSSLLNLSTHESLPLLYPASDDPTALLLLDLLLNVAGAALLGYIGLQLHQGIQRLSAP